jgi:hypothetical protein
LYRVFSQSDRYVLVKSVSYDIWKCGRTKIGLILSVKMWRTTQSVVLCMRKETFIKH